MRILVAEDDENSRLLLETVLTAQGYGVDSAADGVRALECAQHLRPDLIISDILMPKMDGFELCRRCKDDDTLKTVPFVFYSATYIEEKDRRLAMALGASRFIIKPVEITQLLAIINEILDAYKKNTLPVPDQIETDNLALERMHEERLSRKLDKKVRELQQEREALRASEARYRALYDDAPWMFFTLDTQAEVLSVNRYGAEYLGYRVDELVGRSAPLRQADGGQAAIREHIAACLKNPGSVQRWQSRALRKHDNPLWVRLTARAVPDSEGRTTILCVCEDITEAQRLSEQLSYQGSHDALTGLVNRRRFEQHLQQILAVAGNERMEHALCYLDLDQFKIINDACGHTAGDELLRQLAGVLRNHVRRGDSLARLGGDEFGVLMEYCSLEQAQRVADALRQAIQDFRFLWEGRSFSLGVSIGLVPIDQTSGSISAVLRAADSACYIAKEQGRNRIHIYHADDAELSRRHGEMQSVAHIQQALADDRFRLCFQPIIPLLRKGNEGEHYELLLRMEDASGYWIPPGAFLPAAERYGLAAKLDRWVVGAAFDWFARHPGRRQSLYLCAINLSGHSLVDQTFLEFVLEKFSEGQVAPAQICFEITETAAIANLSSATRFITTLKARGCRFALDDFGSGLSSFAYLKTLPVDFLKIDGLFVRDIVDDPINLAMVKSINEIGQVMGKRTIAEFVENQATLEKLTEIGIDYAQGYGIGRPLPIDNMV